MIVDQLTNIYLNLENWHSHKLNQKESNEYHERLLLQGNIITYVIHGKVIGYIEFWCINFEQLGRIVCGDSILTDVENILDGKIAYINNMWINPGYREGAAFEMLATMFLVKNKDAEFFCAIRRLKHQHPVQVYTRQELIKLYTKGI